MSIIRVALQMGRISQRSANFTGSISTSLRANFFSTGPQKNIETESGKTTQGVAGGPDKTSADTNSGTARTGKSDGEEELNLLYDETLRQVIEYGWTDRAIEAAVSELGWSPAAKRMIARGPAEVVEEFVVRSNRQLAETLAIENDKDAAAAGGIDPVGRTTFAMRERLSMIEPYHNNWARALALQAFPQNSPRAVRSAALLVDEFAHYAGYRSSDMSWYTDRAVLGVAYHAAELYWLTDKSPRRAETWRFIETRLRDCHDLRTRITSTYENIMTLSDAASGSMKTILRSARRSY